METGGREEQSLENCGSLKVIVCNNVCNIVCNETNLG